MQLILYVGTKNASSWSLRAWLALREQGLAFKERIVDLRYPQRLAELVRVERLMSRPSVGEWMKDAAALPPVYLDEYGVPQPEGR